MYVCQNYARYRTYKDLVEMIAVVTSKKLPGGWYAEKGESLAIDVKAHLAGNKRIDGDNILKSIMDACTQTVWHDDSQVDDARIRKYKVASKAHENVEIKIWKL